MSLSGALSAPLSAGRAALPSRLVCAGCGFVAAPTEPFVPRCPQRRPGDDVDHLMRRIIEPAAWAAVPSLAADPNPFVAYRTRLHAYHVARAAGWSDERFVALVRGLDEAIAAVDGRGFRVTPLTRVPELAKAAGLGPGGAVWVKDETGAVAGSHKARHLMAAMLELQVAEAVVGLDARRPLAIASCGNAALAAAVVARAADRRLLVFVLEHADEAVVRRLHELGARVEVCARRPGEVGDPSVRRLEAALVDGAVPFTCQGDRNGLVIEGGATLGWELIDGLSAQDVTLDRLIVQVGGGALASAQALAFDEAVAAGSIVRRPRLDTVQTSAAWPLARAYRRVAERLGATPGEQLDLDGRVAALADVAAHRSAFMWPWETEPRSIAEGILDDETYDWLAIVRAMLATGGRPVVVDEATLAAANALGLAATGIDADETGTAGLAGLVQLARDGHLAPDEQVAVIFSGIRRSSSVPGAPADPQAPDRSPS